MSDSELTRWADSDWAPLVRGQRITVMHGGFSGDYQVVDITPGSDGAETYHLEPAGEAIARGPRGRQGETGPPEHHGEPLHPIEPYDLTAGPKAYVMLEPGWQGRLAELAPRAGDAVPFRSLAEFSGEFSGTFYPGAAERLVEAMKRHPGYCEHCDGFPCQGNHPVAEGT